VAGNQGLTAPQDGDTLQQPWRHPTSMSRHPLSRVELLQGTLDFIILQTLRRGPRHGYGIAQIIRATSNDALPAETGSLHPPLPPLAKTNWISADSDLP